MSTQVVATLYHFVVLAFYSYVYAYYKLEVDSKLPHHRTYGKDLKFLTVWSVLFQICYFFLCCVTDLIATSGSRSRVGQSLMGLRDWFLCSVAFPIGTLVTLMYWGIYAVEPELIYPERIRDIYPMWLSHCMHSYLIPLMLADMYLVKHKQPKRAKGIFTLLVVGVSYLVWLLYLGFQKDIWVYPVLEELHGMNFVFFIAFVIAIQTILYFITEKINISLGKNRPDPDLMYAKID